MPSTRSAEALLDRLRYVHELLADPDRSSVRLVLNLERVSIQEAQRSFTYFHLYGYPTDMIVANRVLPVAAGHYFDEWREAQARYLPLVEQQFAPVPVRTVPYFDHEMVGLERLESSAARCSATATRRRSCTVGGPTGSSAKATGLHPLGRAAVRHARGDYALAIGRRAGAAGRRLAP